MFPQRRGIGAHLQKFYQKQLSICQTPNPNLLTSLKSLSSIIQQKHESLINRADIRAELQDQITYDQAKLIKEYKEKIKLNQKIIKVVQICRSVDRKMLEFGGGKLGGRLEDKLGVFRELYVVVGKLEEQFTGMANQLQKSKNKAQQQQLRTLKQDYFIKLQQNLYKHIIQSYYIPKKQQQLQQSLQCLKLPRKKQKKQKLLPQIQQQLNPNIGSNSLHSYIIIQALFNQYCCYCLQKKIDIVLDRQEENQEEGELQRVSYVAQNGEFQDLEFQSLFFRRLWNRVCKSIVYLFLTPGSGNQGSAYQIEQPNWMFEYMQQIFTANYDIIIKLLHSNKIPKQITEYIQTYFITYNMSNFFLKFIILRFDIDLKSIKQSEKSQSKKVNLQLSKRNSFLIFNFLDELYMFSEKIYESYDHQPAFVESVLLWAQKQGQVDVLQRAFDYEHQFIEQRILNDFSNINYSSMTNLKNMQAYNITINFTQIFEKLYSKYRKISTEELKTKINEFYYEKILQLVRHIVTSFERIYNYSGIDKYQTLISFKKVQNQFRAYFQGFISQSPSLQRKIQDQYYSVLDKYVAVLALEELTPLHQKIYKQISVNNDAFRSNSLETEDLSSNKAKWSKIFQGWQQKLSRIAKLQADYEDKKLRDIFFVFLQQTQFSQDGYLYFMSLFEPFLVILFNIEKTGTIKMLLDMEKGALNEYCKTHPNSLWFLTSSELRAIKKTKIKYVDK